MKTHLNFSETENSQLRQIKDHILKAIAVEKIICFGSTLSIMQRKSCFQNPVDSDQSNSYFLLIVPAPDEKREEIEIQHLIETSCRPIVKVTAVVHFMKEINPALRNGSYFFTTIYFKGIMLYDKGLIPFSIPQEDKNVTNRITNREKFWGKWYNLSNEFLKGAQFYSAQQSHLLAIFMLHQTLEHCYIGMLRVLTGYRAPSHSLPRLISLTEHAVQSPSFFIKKNPEDARLLDLLIKGYRDLRYRDNFEITYQEVKTLTDRVQKILEFAVITCNEKLRTLKENDLSVIQ